MWFEIGSKNVIICCVDQLINTLAIPSSGLISQKKIDFDEYKRVFALSLKDHVEIGFFN